jgi:hypothetical protein
MPAKKGNTSNLAFSKGRLHTTRPIRRIEDLSVDYHDEGRLPSGVIARKGLERDFYRASKDALITAGIAHAEWFPEKPMPGKRPGTTKRHFFIDGIFVRDLHPTNLWLIELPVSEEEKSRRRHEWERYHALEREKREEQARAEMLAKQEREELEFKHRLDLQLGKLPPLAPGSMSEGEIYAARIMRALNDRHWNVVLNLAERYLASQQPPRGLCTPLQLVVDNDRGA